MKTFFSRIAVAMISSIGGLATAHATTSQTILTQVDAQALIHVGEEKAAALNAHVCIAVLDQSGKLLAFERMDTAPIGCVDSAILKARAAVNYRTPTDQYMERANGKEPAIATLPGMVPLGGGAPVVYQGSVIGAVGISGSANPNEIAIAKEAAGSLK